VRIGVAYLEEWQMDLLTWWSARKRSFKTVLILAL